MYNQTRAVSIVITAIMVNICGVIGVKLSFKFVATYIGGNTKIRVKNRLNP
jgi:hypothetical protein